MGKIGWREPDVELGFVLLCRLQRSGLMSAWVYSTTTARTGRRKSKRGEGGGEGRGEIGHRQIGILEGDKLAWCLKKRLRQQLDVG